MFGYVQIRKPELKIKDYELYHSFYCGLCMRLKKRHGFTGQMTLTYDMTFLVILLSSVYDVTCEHDKKHCVVHPVKKHLVTYNEVTDYCADINVLLAYYNFLDDKNDDHSVKAYAGTYLFDKKSKSVREKYIRQAEVIESSLRKLSDIERDKNEDIITAADCFGKLLGEIFVYREDTFAAYLREMGYYLGRYIYVMDAYDDLEEDIRKNRYNPFSVIYGDKELPKKAEKILLHEISMACGAFEKLPCVDYIDILRNILYAGVWNKYDDLNRKKEENEQILKEEE